MAKENQQSNNPLTLLDNLIQVNEKQNESIEINNDNDDNLSIYEKTKLKREELFKYAIDSNSTNDDFNNIIDKYKDIPYTVSEALELSQPNFTIYNKLNQLTNNFDVYYNKKIAPYILQYAKNNNPLNIQLNRINKYDNNPYYRQGISNKEFSVIWKLLLKKYPELKNSDKELICKNYTIEELKAESGYNDDQVKEKVDLNDEDAFNLDLSIPKTKGELFSYWSNLSLIYNSSDKNIFGNISQYNMNDFLSDIKIVFITIKPDENDFNSNVLYYNSKELNTILKQLEITESKDFIILNVCNRIEDLNDNNLDHIANCFKNIFDKILDTLPKDCILMPINQETIDILGFNDKSIYYKYKKRLVWPIINFVKDNKYSLKSILKGNQKRPSVKHENNYNLEILLNSIKNYKQLSSNINNIDNNNKIDKIKDIKLNDIIPNNTRKKISYKQLQEELSKLNKYNIVYTSKCLYKAKTTGKYDKKGDPYVCLRNGLDKKVFYVEPTIDIGYSINNDAKFEEPYNDNSRLQIITQVPYSQIYQIKQKIIQQYEKEPSFYNIDFPISTYINSEIRNRMKYEEGINNPRILVLDFETEKEATKIDINTDVSTSAKCRLSSVFDILTKTFYCAVLRDHAHHTDDEIEKIKNTKEHDGYKVFVDIFDNEIDLWKWTINKIIELDPDILTGWNVEKFDCTFGILRCNTLGLKFRNKYSEFQFVKYNDGSYNVCVDGCAIIDYEKLYKKDKQKKQEKYSLEYICQLELKYGKRKKIVENHDIMYFNYLYEYFLYNIEDNERIYDLENKTNYIKFEYEMCNVCNISWDDIYAQTRHIDGLIYNYAWDNHKSLLKSKCYDEGSSNIKLLMLNDLKLYCDQTGTDLIADGTISLRDYINRIENEIRNIPKDDKGYEGAVVLSPQIGVHSIVADLDASQMYPRLMIRSNIFVDTLCAIIAFDNENLAEKWLYDRDNFPSEILIKEHNKVDNKMLRLTKSQFKEYLKDKILTPFGTMYIRPKINRSLISNLLISLIKNRTKYKNLLKKELSKLDQLKEKNNNNLQNNDIIESIKLIERYDNLQKAYKSLINSFYGAMAAKGCRINNMYSAASITASGRELTRMVSYFSSKYIDYMIKENKIDVQFDHIPINVKTLVGLENIENRKNVIYGDTDSAFLWIYKVIKYLYKNDIDIKDQIKHGWIIIEQVSQFINKYVIKDILRRKDIDFDDDDKEYNYEYKKEIVAGKILFGDSKKQYAMHMMLREGEPVDKIEIVGMNAIKSDTARMSRDLAKDIINYILTEYDTENIYTSNKAIMKIYENALEKIETYMDNGDSYIGTPSSLVNDVSDYKTLGALNRGMLLYDTFFDDHKYVAQDKGYQYYISNINWEKLNITPDKVKKKFKEKYGKCKWYDKMMSTCTDNLFFSSITIPSSLDKLDTSIFIIDREKTINTIIKEKVRKIMALVGINRLDEDDDKKLMKSAIKKIDNIDSLLDDFNFKI